MKLINIFLFIFFSPLVFSGEVFILAKLKPAGTIEIASPKLLGQLIDRGDRLTADRLYVEIKTLSSGVTLRDQHLHRYLMAENQSEIFLNNLIVEKKSMKGKGELNINGHKKKIIFDVVKEKLNHVAKIQIDKRDYMLPRAEYMGISVRPVIDLKISIYPRDITSKVDL